MGAKKTYTVSAFILILIGVSIAVYPLVGYYSSIYVKSPHSVLKPGSRFVYAGYYPFHNLIMVYNITYVGDGKFRVNFILYNQSGNSTIYPFYSARNSGRIVGNITPIFKKTRILSMNNPLIQTLFPQDKVTVYALNYSKSVKLEKRKYPFSFDFSPDSVGFPTIYAPGLQGNFSKKVNLIAYYRSNDRYFARTLLVIGRNAPLDHRPIVDGLPVKAPIGVTISQLDMQDFIPTKFVPNGNWSYVETFPAITLLNLFKTNVQSPYQNWLGALEASFVQFSAPLDYILILMGVVLLILAGRSGQ